MIINTFKYYILDALKSLKRNITISLASAITVTITLFIMGIFLILMENVNLGMNNIQSQIEIKAFLKDEISSEEQENIGQELKVISGVKDIEFEDKAKALEKFSEQISEDNSSLLDNYSSSNNPLPNSYIVKLENPEISEQVISSIKNIDGIESVGTDKEFTDKIVSISKNIKWFGLSLFILLTAISVFLISNTIKLAIYSRRREIGIMKFVGATDWFIRWPFIIEGAVIGLVGAVSANVLVYSLYKIVFIKINESLLLVNLISPSYVTQTLQWQFILAGVVIGGLGSSLSLFKFLKV
ncbi:FtsX-like permease family protein [Clostridium chromiireducens]|uniref:Cell division protein FtsX n=1 Tax=Clostridium chromiireducens TaxID=225345 RepID=A0A964RLD0_9CLOT|nr:permease-like cell division protein FtsX [Clostridium chromiireducens]MVX63692.1 FtsX-like permease family protein [Clostridium chromiireducens]